MTSGEQEAADAELRAVHERLEGVVRRLKDASDLARVVDGAIHELNNIATVVKGDMDLALEQLEALYQRYPELRP